MFLIQSVLGPQIEQTTASCATGSYRSVIATVE